MQMLRQSVTVNAFETAWFICAAVSPRLAAVAGELGGGQYCTRATIRGLAQPLGTAWELPSNRLTHTKPSELSQPLPGCHVSPTEVCAAVSHRLAAVGGELGGGPYCTRATIRGLAHPLGTTWELPSNWFTYTKQSKLSRPLLG